MNTVSLFLSRTRVAFWIVIGALYCAHMPIAQADVSALQATVDKNPIMLDESFTLTVTADGDAERDAFDSSALLNDFVVGRTSVSSQTRMINFSTTRSTTWSTVLFPRSTGTFTIPAFTIEGVSSEPFSVEVVPVSNGTGQETRDIFVTSELASTTVYLHQQVHYTVKLYLAKDIERGSLQAPALDEADIQQIGNDAEYSEIFNGKRYRIIERHFVITPQRSGTLTIPGAVFQGEVIANSRQSFGFFNRTQSVSRVSPTLELTVNPIPSDIDGHFLPSEFVDIQEEWSVSDDEWQVGEPVTRTLTLTALGVTESMLPDIDDQYPPDIKTYPDQANTATAEKDRRLIAQRTESIALIPSRAGQFVIPPVTVQWFNVVTQETQTVSLPGRSITVKASTTNGSLPAQSPVQPSNPPKDAADDVNSLDNDAMQPSLISPVAGQNKLRTADFHSFKNPWVGVSVGLLAIWLITLVWGFKQRRHSPTKAKPSPTTARTDTEKAAWQQLSSALKSQQVQRIEPALKTWLQAVSPSHAGQHDLRQMVDSVGDRGLKDAINQMYASRYRSQAQEQWHSQPLMEALESVRQKHKLASHNEQKLPPLHPQ
ncbi:BatD family protein [Alteromonas oceanisediminis]|uniref:BatD family protein n=1 Tax=Alteromonas oceanisediminis TaxID=2836180 RepID=UPI001BD9EAB8|nr:BatD family protein [Alteromonas oceanisediminis]MBT0587515.1 BatD family protein [Alteromonas oceanisediminis]